MSDNGFYFFSQPRGWIGVSSFRAVSVPARSFGQAHRLEKINHTRASRSVFACLSASLCTHTHTRTHALIIYMVCFSWWPSTRAYTYAYNNNNMWPRWTRREREKEWEREIGKCVRCYYATENPNNNISSFIGTFILHTCPEETNIFSTYVISFYVTVSLPPIYIYIYESLYESRIFSMEERIKLYDAQRQGRSRMDLCFRFSFILRLSRRRTE